MFMFTRRYFDEKFPVRRRRVHLSLQSLGLRFERGFSVGVLRIGMVAMVYVVYRVVGIWGLHT